MEVWQNIRKEILSWPGVEEKPNKYGTPHSFFINGKEFAHFHSNSQLDIDKTEKVSMDDRRVEPNPFTSRCFLFNFKTDSDARDALSLVKAAYQAKA